VGGHTGLTQTAVPSKRRLGNDMGKKKGRNRKKKQQYTVHEFKDIFCAKCELCPYGIDPFFCFNHVYKQAPKEFVKNVFNRLLRARKCVIDGSISKSATPGQEVANIFNLAFGGAHFQNRKKARILFAEQMASEGQGAPPKKKLSKAEKKKLKREAKRRRKRYIVQAYPYFFCNEGFREEIDTVLGNNNQQQDKVKEPAGGDEANPGETADDTKP